MAKQTAKTPETPAVAAAQVPADYQALVESNGQGLAAMMKASEAMMRGMASLGREMMGFADTRLRHNIATSESLLQCRDPERAFEVQCDYAREATRQYLEETSRLMSLASETVRDSWSPLEHLTRDRLHDLNHEES